MRIRLVALWSLLAAAVACSGDSGIGRPAAAIGGDGATPAPSSKPGAAVTLTEAMAQPYWQSGVAGAAFGKFQLEEWRPAADGFRRYLAGDDAPTDATEVARVRLLIAIADSKLGDWKQAAAGFEKAAADLPLIADYIYYEAARANYFAKRMDRALELARKVAADSIRGADAELLAGDILRARGSDAEVAAHYDKYITDRPKGIRRAEAHVRLAAALHATGDDLRAARVYRTVTIKWPTSSWGKKATEALDELLGELPADQRKQLTSFTADELIEKGTALYDAMRNPESAAVFAEVLAAPGLTAEQACTAAYHQANSWFKERNRTKSAPLFDDAMARCEKAGDTELQIKAAYQAGRSYDKLDKETISAARFATCEKLAAAADHSYADDCRLRQAEAYQEMGDGKTEEALLAKIPELYADGDMRAEAVWRVAWRSYRAGNYDKAIRWLKKQIDSKPLEDKYYAEGQPQYWLGRIYGKQGKTAESIAAYREAIDKYPLSYYSLLALNRLREAHPDQFATIAKQLAADPPGYDPTEPAFSFKPRALYGEAGFRRGIEFLRLGLGWASEAEMARLDLTPPDGKDEVTDPEQREKLWAMALLHHNAGRYEPSHWVTRWHVLDYKRKWPVGHNRARWEIAYPKAWWALVGKHADKHGYPMELQMGIVREESAFDPLRESWANAIGLTQMIFPTAERFGKGTGIAITRENLRDPEKNMTIGSNFLAFLWDKWDKHTALVPPSYNAGENAVARWLRTDGKLATDEFAEAIPGDQPRRYSKRVLASYFAYSYLYSGVIPVMRNDIPKSLIPRKR